MEAMVGALPRVFCPRAKMPGPEGTREQRVSVVEDSKVVKLTEHKGQIQIVEMELQKINGRNGRRRTNGRSGIRCVIHTARMGLSRFPACVLCATVPSTVSDDVTVLRRGTDEIFEIIHHVV